MTAEQQKRLIDFANSILEIRFNIDGADVQDLAVKHGLLIEETRSQICGADCVCDQYLWDTDREWKCYRSAAWLDDVQESSIPIGTKTPDAIDFEFVDLGEIR